MIVTLIRHPAVELNGERCIGQTDVGLSPEGIASLDQLAKMGARLNPMEILCSDLTRCRVLAEAIAVRSCVQAVPQPVWREASFGAWEGRTWQELSASCPQALNAWMGDFVMVAPPGGESFFQVQQRVVAAMARLADAAADSTWPRNGKGRRSNDPASASFNVLIVTHGGVIRSAICAFADLPLRQAFNLNVPFGSQTHFQREGSTWKLLPSERFKFFWERVD